MVSFYGDYDTTETVVIPFNSFDSNDPSASVTLTNLAPTDVYIYKDGSLTQRTSFAGIAVDVDVDGIAGCHWVTVDLSDNTDAGFYVAGSRYQVRIEGVTIDGATVNAWIGAFSIGCTLRPTTNGRTLDVTATGAAGIDWANVENPTTAVDLSATDIQLCDTVTTLTGHTAQTGDTYAIANGATGFNAIDTVVDAIKVKTDYLPSATAGAAGGVFIAGTNAATTITTALTTTFTGNLTGSVGSVTGAVGSVTGAVGSVTAGVTLANGAITDASLAGNMEIVFETDFATNYNTTRNAWATNAQDFVGTTAADPFSAQVVAASVTGDTKQTADHTTSIAAILEDTAEIGAAGVGLTEAGGTGDQLTALGGFTAGAIDAAAIANAAIDAATFAAGAIDSTAVGLLDNSNFTHVDANERVDVGKWLGTAATSGTGGPDVNVNAVGDSTTAATNLSASALGIVTGQCEGTPSTTVIQTDLAEATDDHYIGRVVVFTSGAAAGQATDITDYTGSSGTITVTALTTAPAATDTFVIV